MKSRALSSLKANSHMQLIVTMVLVLIVAILLFLFLGDTNAGLQSNSQETMGAVNNLILG